MTPVKAASTSQSPEKQTEYSTMAPTPGMRRKNSLGPLRRAHPASGATWNVEVIRGKMTSRCLWHACRATVLGMVLMVLGAGMATIGYYAVPLPPGQVEKGSNSTAFIKNLSRGYHLNNLSYIGPIVMGFGGFIVVAACVMTFEARDSAAKVVPARFKMGSTSGTMGVVVGGGGGSGRTRNSSGIRRGATGAPNGGNCPPSVGSQTTTTRWDRDTTKDGGTCRAPPADNYPDRQALTAALIHFSRALGTPGQSPSTSRRPSRVSRSGSVPNLHGESNGVQSPNRNHFLSKGVTAAGKGFRQQLHFHAPSQSHHNPHHYHSHHRNHHSRRSASRHSSLTKRFTREQQTDRFLHPMLKYHRHALSVDETLPPPCLRPILSNSRQNVLLGSQPTMNRSSSPTHDALRQIKRSDTAKQHILARQRNVEKEENNTNKATPSPKAIYSQHPNVDTATGRRSSTVSDASAVMVNSGRRTPISSRTPSTDSRIVGCERGLGDPDGKEVLSTSTDTVGVQGRSVISVSPKTWRVSGQLSTPSVEKEFRSQLSICSEPASSPKTLSCQSSIEPSVPEEDHSSLHLSESTSKPRPGTLILECPLTCPTNASKYLSDAQKSTTSSFKRKQPRKPVQKNASVAEIYFISTAEEPNKDYDSIEVIDERRNKSFGHSSTSINATELGITNPSLERRDTVIYRDSKSTVAEEGQDNNDRTLETNAPTTMTIMAEIEQQRRRSSSNSTGSEKDTLQAQEIK